LYVSVPSFSRKRVVPWVLGVVLVLAAAGVAVGGLYEAGAIGGHAPRSQLRHVVLPPLTPGPERLERGKYALAEIEGTSFDDMVGRAEAVFVGEVAAIGGPEMLDPGTRMEAHRVRFAVEDVLRGARIDAVDVTDLVWSGAIFPAEVGQRYLVFAEHRQLGMNRIRRLVAFGYPQGVYRLIGDDRARNDANGTVKLQTVRDRVATAS
jgi:hypothetical protein